MSPPPRQALAVIGGGTIAQAILLGDSLDLDLHQAAVAVAEPDEAKRQRLAPSVAAALPTAPEALDWLQRHEPEPGTGQLLLAIKPQSLTALAAEIGPALAAERPGRVVISVMAGTTTARIQGLLGGRIAVVRAMPNLPIRVRQGMTALALGAGANPGDESFARAIFSGFGQCVDIDEAMMDAFTAVAGSGPAYIFYLAEAMTRAAAALGFDSATANRIVRETIAGAGTMLAESFDPPATLRAAVTSKGGTTEAALAVLDHRGVADAVIHAITAARDRGAALAAQATPV